METNAETKQTENGIGNTSTNTDSEENISHSNEDNESDSDESVGEVQNEGLDNLPDDSSSQSPILRRSSRVRRPPARYGKYDEMNVLL